MVLVFFALATGLQFALAEPWGTIAPQSSSLSGWAENNNGRLRLVLTNNSPQQFRGTCRISLGGDGDQKDLGQIEVTLPAQETILLQLSNVTPAGQQYTLAIFDQKGARRFFKVAPVRQVSDSTPATLVAVTPIPQAKVTQTKSPLLLQTNDSPSTSISEAEEAGRVAPQVQVEARLLADEDSAEFFTLSLELRTARPMKDAKISITAGKIKQSKTVSIYSQGNVGFKLPERLEAEQIHYTVMGKDGRMLAKGELDIQQLMADGVVIAKDIRTDRSSYDPGESAQITILLEGKSLHGFRVEASAKDGQSQMVFRDQRTVGPDDRADSQEFNILIPTSVAAPVLFEFKIFDTQSGLLLDSGEREIPVSATKSPRRPER